MRPVDGELLRLLADMPFLDRLDMVAVSGWSRGGVYRAVPRLEDAGLIASEHCALARRPSPWL